MAALMLSGKRVPVVVILGATGSGKSKLALEIAQLFKSEIISADSMQIYKGLDIVTNKVTREEQQQCPHHMIDYVSPLQEKHTVVEFRDKAVPIINNLLQKKILPIIVGGTNYYIEALLYNFLISQKDVKKARQPGLKLELSGSHEINPDISGRKMGEEDGEKSSNCDTEDNVIGLMDSSTYHTDIDSQTSGTVYCGKKRKCDDAIGSVTEGELVETVRQRSKQHRENYEELDCITLHKRLQEVDPEIAERMHPNDKRKVIRSANRWCHHSQNSDSDRTSPFSYRDKPKRSERSRVMYEEKGALEVFDMHGVPISEAYKAQKIDQEAKRGPLRYKDICVFWVQSDLQVLETRIDKRTDEMIDRGLIQELSDFHHQYNISRIQENKEVDYTHGIFQSIGFKEFHKYLIMSEVERQSEAGQTLLKEGIESMKLVTKQYAKKQIRHIRKMFLRRQNTELPPVYGLNSTDVSKWKENVHDQAIKILNSVIEGRTPNYDPLPIEGGEVKFVYNFCDSCQQRFLVEHEWLAHIKSRRHYKKRRSYNHQRKKLLTETCQILDAAVIGSNIKVDKGIMGTFDGILSEKDKDSCDSSMGIACKKDTVSYENSIGIVCKKDKDSYDSSICENEETISDSTVYNINTHTSSDVCSDSHDVLSSTE